MLLRNPDLADSPELEEDAARLNNLPAEAIEELRAYLQRLLNGETSSDPACVWLDRPTNACRYYDHRPSIWREFFHSPQNQL